MVDLRKVLRIIVAHTYRDQIGLHSDHELDLTSAVQHTVAHELTHQQDDCGRIAAVGACVEDVAGEATRLTGCGW
jgi:hypothetical protein